jgi:hypothetical protein
MIECEFFSGNSRPRLAEREGLLGAPRLAPSGRPAGVIPAAPLLELTDRGPLEIMSRLAEREGFEPSKGF